MSRVKKVLKRVLDQYPSIKEKARRLLATIPLPVRLGRKFWHWYAFFEESEQWSVAEISRYQIDCLQDLLTELSQTSKFYRERLAGIDIESFETLQQFETRVPTLSREQFRDNYSDVLSSAWKKQDISKVQTSGTTGAALQFYHPAADAAREWAAICHQWKRVGYIPGESKRAEFRGLTTPDKLVQIFPDWNMIRCSILNLKREHVLYYADAIRKYAIGFYHGYPSALYLLSKEICDSGIDFPQPRAVLLASEIVYDWQLDKIRAGFPRAGIFAHYGCAERTVLAGWCEHREEYHVLPQYSIVEVDSENSEIIGTNLFNQVNGFVRYRMKDTAPELKFEPCPDCGRPYIPRLIRLAGRTEDYVYSPEKGWIPPAIITYPLKALNAVQEMQFLQKKREELEIHYTVRDQADICRVETELDHVQIGLRRLLGEGIDLRFERVDDFDRGPTGKFKWIICELDDMYPG